jgi:hypothetical protein
MIVKTELLPKELKSKLPLSFQIIDEFDTNLLRDQLLKHEIENWYSNNILQNSLGIGVNAAQVEQVNISIGESSDTNRVENILDFVPEKNKYSLSLITDPVDFIILNVRNFLRTPRGALVFDPSFGTKIYSYLKSLSITQIKEMLYIELNEFISDLISSYDKLQDISVKIKNISIQELTDETGVSVSYNIAVTLDINSEEEVVLTNEFKL